MIYRRRPSYIENLFSSKITVSLANGVLLGVKYIDIPMIINPIQRAKRGIIPKRMYVNVDRISPEIAIISPILL